MSDRRTLFADLPTRPSYSRPADNGRESDEDDDTDDASRFFSLARGVRQFIPMLELRFKGGNRRAFEYSMLEEVAFDPSKGISLYFGHSAVVIEGRHLDKLFGGLVRHAVRWVREAEQNQLFEIAEPETVTTSIKVIEQKGRM